MSLNTNQVTDTITPSTGVMSVATGNLAVATVGNGLQIKEGTNARMGVSTMSAGTVTVSNNSITATTRIFLTCQTRSGAYSPAAVSVTARTAGTSFRIDSGDSSDTSSVAWLLIEPA